MKLKIEYIQSTTSVRNSEPDPTYVKVGRFTAAILEGAPARQIHNADYKLQKL